MYIRDFMQTNVITVPSETLIIDAQKLMEENNVRRLPVVDGGKLVGIVTRTKLRDVAPSAATSLSVWELNYLLSKIKVKEVMERKVFTMSPDATVEEAALIMAENKINAVPVVDKGAKVVGMITGTDLFRLLVDVLGVREPGARLHIVEPYDGKPAGRMAEILNRHDTKILSVFTFTHPRTKRHDMVMRISLEDASEIIKDFRANGYEVEETK